MKYAYFITASLLIFACQQEVSEVVVQESQIPNDNDQTVEKEGEEIRSDIQLGTARVKAGDINPNEPKSAINTKKSVSEDVYINGHVPTKRVIPYQPLREANSMSYGTSVANFGTDDAGKITAGEVNDLSEWQFWSDIKEDNLRQFQSIWRLNPGNRISFLLMNESHAPIVGAEVVLYGSLEGETDVKKLWTSRTDNTGIAHTFGTIHVDQDEPDLLEIDTYHEAGKITPAYAEISYGTHAVKVTDITFFDEGINLVTLNVPCNTSNKVDIAFAVDATASMQDEIDFLKQDLLDIIQSSADTHENIDLHLGALFYRCEANSYVTKHSDFSSDLEKTMAFINEQNAGEGGDEVVAKALDESINQLSWREDARTKLLFIVLDEPPGSNPEVNEAMEQAYRDAAAKGIKLIPCVASGTTFQIDRSLEYVMRSGAIATGGTYVFFTNDSGIGNNHTLPIVKSFEVEKLNALLKRIIKSNLETTPCEPQHDPIASSEDLQHNMDEQTREALDSLMLTGTDSLILASLLPYTDYETIAALDSSRPLDHLDTTQFLEDFRKEVISLKVYPVPTRANVTVEVTKTPDSYALLDGHGRLILYVDNPRESTFKVDLSGLPRGTYFLRAFVGETDLTSRIIKL